MSAHFSVDKLRIEDSGLVALCGVASYFRIAADPGRLAHELALSDTSADESILIRAAQMLGLKARCVRVDASRLASLPAPTLVRMVDGGFNVFAGCSTSGTCRIVDPITRISRELTVSELIAEINGSVVLLNRRIFGPGANPTTFGFKWFWPSLWRYRKPLAHVLLASLLVQIFALVTPLFFQVIVDKVLVEKTYATLIVLIVGLVILGFFDVVLQYLRTYALSHTTNRIDVELGQRLFNHMLRLPLGYFETRSTGQTAARVRELENIRNFLTGQGLFSALDLVFTLIFIGVMFAYSVQLTLIVLASIPLYTAVGVLIRPALRSSIDEKFNCGAASQQFLVETIVGIATIKAGATEPTVRAQWEEKLAAYVKTAFRATLQATLGQNAILYISKLSTAVILLVGAKAVIDGSMSVGSLVAFNMIAGQVVQPILRLSQIWQDFQQVQTSVERLGDILNTSPEPVPAVPTNLPAPAGAIEFSHVDFRYRSNGPQILKDVSLSVRPGEVIGIVGASGSGKSTLAKLIQRLYFPEAGKVMVDGTDIAHVDPTWLRSHTGVVLQDNLLFNRTVHENIAFANPGLPRAVVIQVARLAGADEFIAKLPQGYDTMIEERGANLSGGQRQRIAIARALATNPRILIFDEATSALDYESERIIQDNMRSIVMNRTVIIIAHRLAAIRHCDRIVGMHDGRIVEIGSHTELVHRANGLYANLWGLQNEQMGVAS